MSLFLSSYYDAAIYNNSTIKRALSCLTGSRCLITGANGIIGYALARLLSAHTSVDLFLAVRNPIYVGREALCGNINHINYSELIGERFDYIFHCATHSPPARFLAEWQDTIRLNTNALLDLLAATDERLIFASSTEIYSGLNKEASELDNGTTSPQHPRGVYIESKRIAEAACARSGVGVATRIALAAGPYPSKGDSRVIFELIRRGRSNRFIALLGGHQSVRQYQYTGACALRMIVSGVLGKELVYNNAGPNIATLENLAFAIAAKLKVPYRATTQPTTVIGAPDFVQISMSRFYSEFPEMKGIDPSDDQFIEWVVADCP